MRRHAINHGVSGAISGAIAAKLLVSKTLLVSDAVLGSKIGVILFDQLLFQVPLTVFLFLGEAVTSLLGIDIPALELGIVLGYPLLFVFIHALISGFHFRRLFGYWLGSTLITLFAVLVSNADQDHKPKMDSLSMLFQTLVSGIRQAVEWLGSWIAKALAHIPGLDPNPAIGIVLAICIIAVLYGILWEKMVGHEAQRQA